MPKKKATTDSADALRTLLGGSGRGAKRNGQVLPKSDRKTRSDTKAAAAGNANDEPEALRTPTKQPPTKVHKGGATPASVTDQKAQEDARRAEAASAGSHGSGTDTDEDGKGEPGSEAKGLDPKRLFETSDETGEENKAADLPAKGKKKKATDPLAGLTDAEILAHYKDLAEKEAKEMKQKEHQKEQQGEGNAATALEASPKGEQDEQEKSQEGEGATRGAGTGTAQGEQDGEQDECKEKDNDGGGSVSNEGEGSQWLSKVDIPALTSPAMFKEFLSKADFPEASRMYVQVRRLHADNGLELERFGLDPSAVEQLQREAEVLRTILDQLTVKFGDLLAKLKDTNPKASSWSAVFRKVEDPLCGVITYNNNQYPTKLCDGKCEEGAGCSRHNTPNPTKPRYSLAPFLTKGSILVEITVGKGNSFPLPLVITTAACLSHDVLQRAVDATSSMPLNTLIEFLQSHGQFYTSNDLVEYALTGKLPQVFGRDVKTPPRNIMFQKGPEVLSPIGGTAEKGKNKGKAQDGDCDRSKVEDPAKTFAEMAIEAHQHQVTTGRNPFLSSKKKRFTFGLAGKTKKDCVLRARISFAFKSSDLSLSSNREHMEKIGFATYRAVERLRQQVKTSVGDSGAIQVSYSSHVNPFLPSGMDDKKIVETLTAMTEYQFQLLMPGSYGSNDDWENPSRSISIAVGYNGSRGDADDLRGQLELFLNALDSDLKAKVYRADLNESSDCVNPLVIVDVPTSINVTQQLREVLKKALGDEEEENHEWYLSSTLPFATNRERIQYRKAAKERSLGKKLHGRTQYSMEEHNLLKNKEVLMLFCSKTSAHVLVPPILEAFSGIEEFQARAGTSGDRKRAMTTEAYATLDTVSALMMAEDPEYEPISFSDRMAFQMTVNEEFFSDEGSGQIFALIPFLEWTFCKEVPGLHGSPASILQRMTDEHDRPIFLSAGLYNGVPCVCAMGPQRAKAQRAVALCPLFFAAVCEEAGVPLEVASVLSAGGMASISRLKYDLKTRKVTSRSGERVISTSRPTANVPYELLAVHQADSVAASENTGDLMQAMTGATPSVANDIRKKFAERKTSGNQTRHRTSCSSVSVTSKRSQRPSRVRRILISPVSSMTSNLTTLALPTLVVAGIS